MDEIRYGIIGAGMMGVEHIRNLLALDGAVVSAIADPHEPSRDTARATIGPGPEVAMYDDYRRLLDAEHCDAVVIATPNMTHFDVLSDALVDDDLHVLVEKPLATTVEDCRRAYEIAHDRRGVVWVGLEYRYMPPISRLVTEIANGTIGAVRMIAVREHRFPFLEKVGNWNRFNRNTGGTLVEKACHFFDLMNHIAASRPVMVMASGGHDVNHLDERYDGETPDILDNAFVIVEYESGVRGMLDLCMFAEATQHMEEVIAVGDRGKVEAFLPDSTIRIGRRGEHFVGHVVTETAEDDRVAYEGLHHGSSYLELLDFQTAILSGNAPAVGLHDGLMSVAVGEAAHRSIDEGRSVSLDELLS